MDSERLTSQVMSQRELSDAQALQRAAQQRSVALAAADSSEKRVQQLRAMRQLLEHATRRSADLCLRAHRLEAGHSQGRHRLDILRISLG